MTTRDIYQGAVLGGDTDDAPLLISSPALEATLLTEHIDIDRMRTLDNHDIMKV